MDYDRWDALLHYLFKQTQGDAWFRPDEPVSSGVALRVSNGVVAGGSSSGGNTPTGDSRDPGIFFHLLMLSRSTVGV